MRLSDAQVPGEKDGEAVLPSTRSKDTLSAVSYTYSACRQSSLHDTPTHTLTHTHTHTHTTGWQTNGGHDDLAGGQSCFRRAQERLCCSHERSELLLAVVILLLLSWAPTFLIHFVCVNPQVLYNYSQTTKRASSPLTPSVCMLSVHTAQVCMVCATE